MVASAADSSNKTGVKAGPLDVAKWGSSVTLTGLASRQPDWAGLRGEWEKIQSNLDNSFE